MQRRGVRDERVQTKQDVDEGRELYYASISSDPELRGLSLEHIALLRAAVKEGGKSASARYAGVLDAFDKERGRMITRSAYERIRGEPDWGAEERKALSAARRECVAMAGYFSLPALVGRDVATYGSRLARTDIMGDRRSTDIIRETRKRAQNGDEAARDLEYAINRTASELKEGEGDTLLGFNPFGSTKSFKKWMRTTAGPVAKAVGPVASFIPVVGPVLGPATTVAGMAMSGDFEAKRKVKTVNRLARQGNKTAQKDMRALRVAAKLERARRIDNAIKAENEAAIRRTAAAYEAHGYGSPLQESRLTITATPVRESPMSARVEVPLVAPRALPKPRPTKPARKPVRVRKPIRVQKPARGPIITDWEAARRRTGGKKKPVRGPIVTDWAAARRRTRGR
jgi:hypothetical protein